MRACALALTRRISRARALALSAFALLGCNLDNVGDAPAPATLYFPNAIALSPGGEDQPPPYLFVANSNFDLRYNAGTVLAFSLDKLEDEIAGCGGTCQTPIPGEKLLEDEARIGSFSTALTYAPSPLDAAGEPVSEDVLLVTTRTDDNLRFVRVDSAARGNSVLRCEDDGPRCDLHATSAIDPQTAAGPLVWPPDPAAVISGVLSDWALSGDFQPGSPEQARAAATRYALVAHRVGQVSLFVEDIDADIDADGRFVLADVLGGLVPPISGLAFDPETQLVYVTSSLGVLSRVRVALDESGATGRLYRTDPLTFEDAAGRPDARDIAFVAGRPDKGHSLAEDSALVVSFDPSALLLVDVAEDRNAPSSARVKHTAVVSAGASRISTGILGDTPVAVVSCFTARMIYVIDVSTMLTRSVVPNLSGPFDLVLDEARRKLYVTDFRSSVIRVMDLSGLEDTQGMVSARLVATIGAPRVVQELR
jgi:hypothetical protein